MLRACTSICSIGDAACQVFQGEHNKYELRRTAAFAASGFFVLGPLSYTILSTATALIPGSGTVVIAKRVLAISCAEPISKHLQMQDANLFLHIRCCFWLPPSRTYPCSPCSSRRKGLSHGSLPNPRNEPMRHQLDVRFPLLAVLGVAASIDAICAIDE